MASKQCKVSDSRGDTKLDSGEEMAETAENTRTKRKVAHENGSRSVFLRTETKLSARNEEKSKRKRRRREGGKRETKTDRNI